MTGTLLGSFTYDEDGEALQTFSVTVSEVHQTSTRSPTAVSAARRLSFLSHQPLKDGAQTYECRTVFSHLMMSLFLLWTGGQ